MGLDGVSPFKAYEGRNEDSNHHILLIQSYSRQFPPVNLLKSWKKFTLEVSNLPYFWTDLRFPQRYSSVVDRFSLVLVSLVAELFEGDIIMDQRLRSWVTGQYDKRDAINDESYIWPSSLDDHGERVIRVPYTLSDEIKRGNERSSFYPLFPLFF